MTSSVARALRPAVLAALLLAGAVMALHRAPSGPPPPSGLTPTMPGASATSGADGGVLLSGDMRWVGIGGGAEPESTQVSLEQDLALAREVLGEEGLVLFAGGPGRPAVQVRDDAPRGDALKERLAILLDPRPGRGTHYRAPALAVDAEGSADNALSVLEALLGLAPAPLLVVVVGHGEPGETPADSLVRLWGGWPLGVRDLAEVLDRSEGSRPVRLVMTTCYGGGFADIAFRGASPDAGPASSSRCGLFAAPWDDEASGCDANPERAAQESYGIHFLQALAGKDRDGRTLARSILDLDGDGRVSLLEAHTRARIASRSIDVPTTTSERWLRVMAPVEGPEAPFALPEEDAVIASLGVALQLPSESSARARLSSVEAAVAAVEAELAEAELVEDDAFYALRIELLARWPVLDDPWHPDFEPSLTGARAEITALLDASPVAVEHARAEADRAQLEERHDRLRGERALLARLVRAHETRQLARRLAGRGGPDLAHYQALLACERGQP